METPHGEILNLKKFKKNFENPLDKIPNLWYNKDVSKREKKIPC